METKSLRAIYRRLHHHLREEERIQEAIDGEWRPERWYPGLHALVNYHQERRSALYTLLDRHFIQRDKRRYTKEDLLGALRKWRRVTGRNPTVRAWTKMGWTPGYGTFRRHFGTWSNALDKAGVGHGRKWVGPYKHKQ